jgi:hypothetical protein
MARRYRGRHAQPHSALIAGTGSRARWSGWRPPGQARQRPALRVAVALACAAVLAGVLASLPNATATNSTSRFAPVADAYVSQARPDRNFGRTRALRVDASPRSERTFLRFRVAGLPGSVTEARLRLYAETASQGGFTVRTVVAATGWTEDTITYANAPAPGSVVATSGPVASKTWTSVEVTALVEGGATCSAPLSPQRAPRGPTGPQRDPGRRGPQPRRAGDPSVRRRVRRQVAQGRRQGHRRRRQSADLLRLSGRALAAPSDHG